METADSVLEYCEIPINFLMTLPKVENAEVDKLLPAGSESEVKNKLISSSSSSSSSSSVQAPKSIFNKDWLPWLDNNTCQISPTAIVPTKRPLTTHNGSIGGILVHLTSQLLRFLAKPIQIVLQFARFFIQGHSLKGDLR